MGDFNGHPFRGNQWTDGRTVAVTPEDNGVVLSSSAFSLHSRRAGALGRRFSASYGAQGARAKDTMSREGWEKQLKVEQTSAKEATAKMKAVIAEKEAFAKRMSDDLHKEEEAMLNAREAAREIAYKKNPLDPGSQEAYSRAQREVADKQDTFYRAQNAWRKEHVAEEDEIDKRLYEARDERRDALKRVAQVEGALGAYDKEATRNVQTAAEPREPRETPATAFNAMDIHSRGVLNGPLSNNELLSVTLTPDFPSTIRSASDFKAKMESAFPGVSIEGLPRKADLHMLTIVHDEFRALRDEFPEIAVRTVKLNAGGMRATAWSNDDKITFGKHGIESFSDAHKGFATGKTRETPDEMPAFHDGVRSYASVVRHEFAHQVHFQQPELLKAFNDEMKNMPAEQRIRITGYATKNYHERFAETFTLIKYGDKGSKAHPAVQLLDRLTKEHFKRLRSKKS